jgi:hypothetical protein
MFDESIRRHSARRPGEGSDLLTKNVARRVLVAAVGVACAFMLIAVAPTPAAAGSCPPRYVLIKWPRGVAPDYNGNGHVCYSSILGWYVDDSTGRH